MTFEEIEAGLRERLAAFPPAARAELRHILVLPDFDRVERLQEYWRPETRGFAQLLLDIEDDPALHAVVVDIIDDVAVRSSD